MGYGWHISSVRFYLFTPRLQLLPLVQGNVSTCNTLVLAAFGQTIVVP